MPGRAIVYLRVSTARQGTSGLGLEAQREAVTTFANARGLELAAEYVEVESGKRDDRPALKAALSQARRQGATLLIAKLDRLARSVSFVSSLMETGVDFTAVDMPDANRFVLHIMAAVAEHEREQISARTKAALAAAKARGTKLGANSQVLKEKAISDALQFSSPLENSVRDIIASGARSMRQVAAGLDQRGIRTREGCTWNPGNVSRLLRRLEIKLAA